MKVIPTRRFLKDIKRVDEPTLKGKIKNVITGMEKASEPGDIPGNKKLKSGNRKFYRIRVGDYRIGIEIDKSVIYLLILSHRKDIYKKFP